MPPPDPIPTLETPRLRLRPLRVDDAEGLFRAELHPGSTEFIGRPPLPSVEAMREKLAKVVADMEAGNLVFWAVTDRETGAFAGTVLLWHWDKPNRRAELGYSIVPERWGEGLATEAVTPVLAHAFGPMGLHGLHAWIHPDNAASLRVVGKFGFRKEAHLREVQRRGGTGPLEDMTIWGLLEEEWPRG